MSNQEENVYTSDDIEKNKVISALAYFIFFLPLIASPDSPFGKFHANQGLILLIVGVVGSTVLTIIPIIGWLLLPLFSLAVFVFAVLGLINALNGQAKELPIIGSYKILK
jgi:uncharacterized membrane protein